MLEERQKLSELKGLWITNREMKIKMSLNSLLNGYQRSIESGRLVDLWKMIYSSFQKLTENGIEVGFYKELFQAVDKGLISGKNAKDIYAEAMRGFNKIVTFRDKPVNYFIVVPNEELEELNKKAVEPETAKRQEVANSQVEAEKTEVAIQQETAKKEKPQLRLYKGISQWQEEINPVEIKERANRLEGDIGTKSIEYAQEMVINLKKYLSSFIKSLSISKAKAKNKGIDRKMYIAKYKNNAEKLLKVAGKGFEDGLTLEDAQILLKEIEEEELLTCALIVDYAEQIYKIEKALRFNSPIRVKIENRGSGAGYYLFKIPKLGGNRYNSLTESGLVDLHDERSFQEGGHKNIKVPINEIIANNPHLFPALTSEISYSTSVWS